MPEFDPAAEFPNMTPIKKAPTMMRINGCGTAVYGSRDVHGASGAYVTTLCVTILYVPILMLRAYRVARAPQGWYFLGKEPLSLLAKTFNISVIVGVLGIVGAVWWNSYTSSPEYQAAQKMHE